VVPKHRRSDYPSLVSAGAPMSRTEYGSDAAGYYAASNGYGRAATDQGWAEGTDGYDWQEWQDWHDWAPPPTLHPDHPSAPVPRVQFPADHPSGPYPIPRALPAPGAGGRPSPASHDQLRPLPPGPEDGSASRGFAPQSARGAGGARGLGRHAGATAESGGYVAAAAAGAAAGQVRPAATRVQREPGLPRRDAAGYQREPGLPRRDAAGYQREPGLPRRDAAGYQREPGLPRQDAASSQRQAGPGWQETTDYRRETGPFGPGPGPGSGRYQNGRSVGGDSLSRTGQLRALSNGSAVQVAPEAHDAAAAIREAAQLEAATITQHATGQAAAIREAAAQEAAELRARLDAMLGELNRMAPSVTDRVAAPARPAIAPALPGAEPALPRRPSARPATAPARPGAEPGLPRRTSAQPATKPGGPVTRPGGPARQTATQTKTGQAVGTRPPTAGRQRRAARVAMAGTAALLSVALIGAVTYTGIHGFSFFVFRESGQGETPGSFTDANFLAGQKECPGAVVCPATHHTAAPTGKHHKTSTQTTSAKN
jgi:hypothetical protein